MAQAGYTPLSLYYSTTPSAAPTNTNLVSGELAINIVDGKLFYKDNSNVVQTIASKGTGTIGGATTQIQFNNAGALGGSANLTWDGSNIQIGAQGDLRFADSDSSNWVAFQAPATIASNVTWTLPSVDGTSGQVLSTNGSGTLSWATTVSTPGGSDTQIQYNSSNTFAGATGLTTDGSNLTVRAQGDVRFADSDSSNWVAFQGAATIASNVTWTLPSADGTSGQFLSTDGAGTLSWATASGGGGGGTSVTVTQITATASQTTFNVTYTVGQISVYLNGALLASADYTATNGTTVVLATGAAANDIFTAVAYSTVTGLTINTASPFNTWVGLSAGAANTTGASNVAVGAYALDANTFGDGNTALGVNALGANTTGNNSTAVGREALGTNTTGSNNEAFGYRSLRFNTTGQYNVAMGTQSLTNNTTASNNTAIGYQSLFNNTTGANNVAVGAYALDANQTGIDNVAIGFDALGANTSNYNNAFGYQAMYSNTSGTRNNALGRQAMYSNTTGVDNTAVGHAAMRQNSTGFANTAFGGEALYANTTGAYNTAFGYQALTANTTPNGQTGVGYYALASTTTGVNNTAVGFNVMSANTTGSNNAALGYQALDANTTGSGNTAFGSAALTANTTANGNTAIGYATLEANTTGYANTAVGDRALTGNTTGFYNVAVGAIAGDGVTTGQYNTIIGTEAATSAGSTLTTGSYNTIIGCYSGTSAAGGLKQIVIGYNVAGQGDTTVTIGSSSGKIYNSYESNATWTQTSDGTMKNIVGPDTLGLSFINRLNPIKFTWKPQNELPKNHPYYNEKNERDTSTVIHGFVAQEVKAAMDAEGCTTFNGWDQGSDGVQAISREMFISPLVKAIQELSAKCDALQAEINQLKGN